METAILKDGTPINTILLDGEKYDVDGFLVEFKTSNQETFRYRQQSEFKKEDQFIKREGYYEEDTYLDYVKETEPISITGLKKFDPKTYLARPNDSVTVSVVDFEAPYNYFYKVKKYTFNVKLAIDNSGPENYLYSVYDGFKLVGYKIDTGNAPAQVIDVDQSLTAGLYFFNKNFGDFVGSYPSSINDVQKSQLKKVATLIVFMIRRIVNDIFPKIANNTNLLAQEYEIADGYLDYNDSQVTDLVRVLFDMKRNWGYYYDPEADPSKPYRVDFDALFNSNSRYTDYNIYYQNLAAFYDKCYKTEHLDIYPADKKLQYLLDILPPSALGIFPYSFIVNQLRFYSVGGAFSETEQATLISLVLSIAPSHANDFLDFLLEEPSIGVTNFEIICSVLTDARLERISYVNWFVEEQTHKMYFAKAVYELWKVSKYNLDFLPAGVTPIYASGDFPGIDPNTYFNAHPEEFNHNHKLEFVSKFEVISTGLAAYDVNFSSELKGKKINIYKEVETATLVNTPQGAIPGQSTSTNTFFGSFHFYHPILLAGFKPNLELEIALKPIIPAFLFYYVEEFDRIADFDAAISLGVDLTVEALAFYFTGGAGVLKDLRYFRYSTEIGEAMTGPLTAIGEVEVWRGVNALDQVYTMTTSSLAHINQYLITTENDPLKRAILQKNQKIILCLLFGQTGRTFYSGYQAAESSMEVLQLIDDLPAGVAHGLSAEHILLLQTISGQTDVAITTFGNRLNVLDTGAGFAQEYNSVFSKSQRLKFLKSYGNYTDEFLEPFNSGTNGVHIKNWNELSIRNVAEEKDILFVTRPSKVENIIKFYDEVPLRNRLESMSRVERDAFLEKYKNLSSTIFDKFVDSPDLINYWKRYNLYPAVRSEFTLLDNADQIKILEQYGDCSELIFNNIKYNAKLHLKQLKDFDIITHDFAYFIKRRGEMLPPEFIDLGGRKGVAGPHEIDNFIEIELLYSGRARASFSNEAGDIIMQGGVLDGQSIDTMGLSHMAISTWGMKYNRMRRIFKDAIVSHFEKIHVPIPGRPPLNKVVIDFKYMDDINPNLKQEILDFLNGSEFPYPQYNNSTYLIKTNL